MAFRQHCVELQNILNKKLEELDSIDQGDVILTESCSNTFKYALHAAVMDYSDNRKYNTTGIPTIKIIEKILYNIEKIIKQFYFENDKEKIKISIPLMGCGVGGLNKEEVINTYKSFFYRDIKINCEVVIYGYDTNDFQLINKIFNNNTCCEQNHDTLLLKIYKKIWLT